MICHSLFEGLITNTQFCAINRLQLESVFGGKAKDFCCLPIFEKNLFMIVKFEHWNLECLTQ